MGDILAAARDTVAEMKGIGVDTSQAELLLREAEEAFHEAKYERVREIQQGLHESLERQKGELAAKKVEIELASLINDIQIAKSQNLDVREAESYLTKIEGAIQKRNPRQMDEYLRRAKESLARQRRRTVLDRARANLEKLRAMVAQAKAVHADVDDVETLLQKAEDAMRSDDLKGIEPNQKVSLEFGLKPKEAGTMDFDFEVQYTRPLDDGKHQTTDTAVVRVEAEGGYVVDDALLFHSTGALVCRESRTYLPPEENSRAASLETKVKEFVNKAFPRGGKSLQTISLGGTTVLAGRGPQAFLALTLRGKEPTILPLYLFQVLKEIHDSYGPRLEAWTGDPAELPGIRDVVRKVLFATDVEGVSLGPLEDTPVSKVPMLMERGLLAGEGGKDFMVWARSSLERGGYEQGVAVLKNVADATMGPTEEIAKQIRQTIIASKEAGTLQISDEQVNAYVEFLRLALEAAFQAKHRARIRQYWPVARIAVKTIDQVGHDALSAFRN